MLTIFLAYSLFTLALPAPGQEKLFLDNVKARMVESLDTFQKNQQLASLSLAMFMGPEYRLEHAGGYADIGHKVNATPDHIYTLASVSKTITGAVIIDLISQRRLAIDDSVFRYIAGFPKNVTLLDLLNHTSGFQRENENEYYLSNSSYSDIIKYLPKQLKYKQHRYANINYAALGALVEKVTGEPFAKVASDYYFRITGEPLYFANQNNSDSQRHFVKNYVRRYNRPYLHKLVD
ncbi:MAG TPA: serine hydrolase domain-containing protein, partial [bacterium]